MSKKKFLVVLLVVFAIVIGLIFAFQPDAMNIAPGDPNNHLEVQIG